MPCCLCGNNISEPLFVEEIAAYLRVSTRQLERTFRYYFQYSPSQYYLRLRLNAARNLLRHSGTTVRGIAIETDSNLCSTSANVTTSTSRSGLPKSAPGEPLPPFSRFPDGVGVAGNDTNRFAVNWQIHVVIQPRFTSAMWFDKVRPHQLVQYSSCKTCRRVI